MENIWKNPEGFRFRNAWLIVKRLEMNEETLKKRLDKAEIKIQMWELPEHCKTLTLGMKICPPFAIIVENWDMIKPPALKLQKMKKKRAKRKQKSSKLKVVKVIKKKPTKQRKKESVEKTKNKDSKVKAKEEQNVRMKNEETITLTNNTNCMIDEKIASGRKWKTYAQEAATNKQNSTTTNKLAHKRKSGEGKDMEVEMADLRNKKIATNQNIITAEVARQPFRQQ
ncbi:hypothetical protein PIB30_071904 [Stylosanthes scabra]|uniref:Uncharacterized protein n=1 Tax=Stylosanthes scabra TaxID=79078 RepID=A0ABU6RPQ9_9FABA|nr:hypothetical protein [Stylosanthes scabra]